MRPAMTCWMVAVSLVLATDVVRAQAPQDILEQAELAFSEGRLEASLERFGRLAALVPEVAPLLWLRGVTLYELGGFDACAAQFASHHRVNPKDAENAAWHFLCVARAESPARARAQLLPAGPDTRVLRAGVLELFRGTRTPEQLIAEAGVVGIAQFYAHLYTGLYLEAMGFPEAALPHLTAAASERYQVYGGFMNVVAQVHLRKITTGTTGTAGRQP